jgi:hypothetical protein
MEYWSVGVLREVRIAPRIRGIGGAERVTDERCFFQEAAFLVPVRLALRCRQPMLITAGPPRTVTARVADLTQ